MNDATPQRHLRLVNAAAKVAGPMLEELRTELDVPGDFPPEALAEAVADALTAPAPHHSTPIRFVRVTGQARVRMLDGRAGRGPASCRY